MIVSASNYRRLLIPRWRSFTRSLKSREMAMPSPKGAQDDDGRYSAELAKRLGAWRNDKNVVTAAQVVETALVSGDDPYAVEAAEALLVPQFGATALVRRQATLVISRISRPDHVGREPAQDIGAEVAFWRNRTRSHADDPLAWSELSLARLIQGDIEAALKSMHVALHLSPQNRYILRAAARLFCHTHDRDRAYAIIRRNEATPGDPWLMAAEISLAQLTGRKPVFVKKGLDFIERNLALPRQITELAGAIGTFYLINSSDRRSKKLFLSSLADPTANSLAQAEWASPHFNGKLITETQWHRSHFANEALAQRAFRQGGFETALARCIAWIKEERFSSRAYIGASAVANAMDDFGRADQFAREGLRHNPKSAPLYNALAFSLASRGQLNSAEVELRKIAPSSDDLDSKLVCEANHGLIAMRRGNLAFGESIYRQVISRFRQENKPETAATAHAYFAREAANAKHPLAVEILAEAKRWLAKRDYPVARRVIASAEEILRRDASTSQLSSS